MARAIHKLTPERVKHKANQCGLHADGGGLYLIVKRAKAASWVFRYMPKGKAREMGFGSYPEVSLDAARDKAREARALKANGEDPIDARKSVLALKRLRAARAINFGQCVEGYFAAHCDGWRSAKHARDWKVSLETHALPVLGDFPLTRLTAR